MGKALVVNGVDYSDNSFDKVEIIRGDIECAEITISGKSMAFKGHPITLRANLQPNGCTDPVEWSTNSSAITVNNGVVSVIESGKATITAKCGTKTATFDVDAISCDVVAGKVYTVDTGYTSNNSRGLLSPTLIKVKNGETINLVSREEGYVHSMVIVEKPELSENTYVATTTGQYSGGTKVAEYSVTGIGEKSYTAVIDCYAVFYFRANPSATITTAIANTIKNNIDIWIS